MRLVDAFYWLINMRFRCVAQFSTFLSHNPAIWIEVQLWILKFRGSAQEKRRWI